MNPVVRRIAVLLLIFAAGSCGSSPGPGPDPVEPAPAISCPAPITLQILGASLPLNYPAPSATGGSPPVTVACLPVSGSAFPVGDTTVSCSATDSRTRRADCSFKVTLTSGTIGATKYLAFGDSVTVGEDGLASVQRRIQVVLPAGQTYPDQLAGMLRRDYPTQTFDVRNGGDAGKNATQNGENDRLRGLIAAQRPHALLILMGYNDLRNNVEPRDLVNALRRYVQIAKTEFAVPYVFLSNITPTIPGAPRFIHPELLAETNTLISQAAVQESAILVNNYDAFLGREAQLLSDGLHPNALGYEVMAQTFYDAIKRTVGTEPPPGATARRGR